MLPQYPPRVSLANLPTPLRRLDKLSSRYKKNLWLKSDDQSGFVLSGNKVRKLEFLLADALNKGVDLVITCGGVQSNHCRATAFACAQLGLKCHLILRNDPGYLSAPSIGQANHFLDQLCGASYDLYEPREYVASQAQLFKRAEQSFASKGLMTYSIPTGGSNGLGVWGYLNAYDELLEQSKEQGFHPDLIVCASGSGGTQAGLTLGRHIHKSSTRVLAFAVCDSEKYFDRKVRADIKEWSVTCETYANQASSLISELIVETNDHYIGPGYAVAYPELYDCIAMVAKSEGVLLDPTYTGKAFHGMLSELEAGAYADCENIVFIHTGGAFGLFPHAAHFVD